MRIMLLLWTPVTLLAALFITRSEAFVTHSTGIRSYSAISRTGVWSNAHDNTLLGVTEATAIASTATATIESMLSKDNHVSTTTAMSAMRARRERLATLGGVAKVDPGINAHNRRPLVLLSSTKGFEEKAGSGLANTHCWGSNSSLGWVGPRRLAPQAAVGGGRGGKGKGRGGPIRGSLKTGLRGARRALGHVFGRGSRAAQAVGAAGIGMARGKGQQPPHGGGVPPGTSSIDVEGLLRHSKALMKDKDPEKVKRVLILMSDTGGGHRASAQALKAAFDDLYPGAIDVEIVDIWTKHAPWPLNKFVQSYQFMAKRPPIWKAFWEFGRFPPTRRITTEISNIQCHARFTSLIERSEPDLVISVHPLCQDVPMRVMKKMGGGQREIPFVTVVTDLGGAHPTWFHREIDACFVPSDRLVAIAQACGLNPEQIKLHGLPIRPGFAGKEDQHKDFAAPDHQKAVSVFSAEASDTATKSELQRKLGLKPGVKACLVVGGGDGVGGLKSIADSMGSKLGEEGIESQVVVVCGTNEEVKSSLEKESWASNVHKHVKGFVSNMDEWMGAVDCIVTKAGPGTIAEAATRGLPVMLSAFLPGQEAGNVPFVTEGGFGAFSRNPATIAETVTGWLKDDTLRAEMSKKAKEASRPHATYDICRDIGEMLGLPAKMASANLAKSIPAMA